LILTKSINTLVSDIYDLLASGSFKIDADKLAHMIADKFEEVQRKDNLRMSNFGTPCDRKLWYAVNMPDAAEPIPPHTYLKFMYGHIIEEVVMQLIEQAGHEVTHQQEEVEISSVTGHIDALVDGRVVDVKSANSRGMAKFRDHGLGSDDPFGYLSQLGLYLHAMRPKVSAGNETRASFIAVDKELGHIVLDTYEFPKKDWDAAIELKKAMLAAKEPPPRGFSPEPHNKSGNMKLPTPCAYCPHKKTCYPGLRTFIYANGPVYMTRVTKQPEVREVT
jgi:hypothetical protein